LPEKQAKVVSLSPSGITILPDRMRRLRPEVVSELAESIRTQGLLQPIVVRTKPRGGLGYILIAGWHRLMAVRELKQDSIRASVLDGIDADQATLAEIDENLIRADLSPAERAMHIGRRKELYEAVYPQTKQGGAPGKAGGGKKTKDDNLSSFAEATGKATGKDPRSVQRDTARAKGCVVLDEIVGTCLDQGDEIDALCKLLPKEQRILAKAATKGKKVTAKTRAKQIKRTEREQDLGAKQKALPDKKYGVIYADPEWRFEPWSRETGMDRAADNHYPTSVTEVIAARPVETIAADDCVLFLWATAPMMPQAVLVMGAWGFDYKSQIVWRKVRPGDGRGTGYWFINEHELLLVGTRGNVPAPAMGTQWPSVIDAPVGEHSEKPEILAQMIEEYFPNLPKIELNRRGPPRPGWDAWGYEVVIEEAAE
jgi:N6-adenosine-specific RNA methylase IME4/uncharacterized ParB-like nuclease family protein